jgi:hypothetical protein
LRASRCGLRCRTSTRARRTVGFRFDARDWGCCFSAVEQDAEEEDAEEKKAVTARRCRH